MNREQKAAVVDEVAEQIRAADTIFAVDYRGISVKQAMDLRQQLSEAGARFQIVKNRLTQQGMRAIPQILAHSYYFGYSLPSRAYRPLSVATFALEVQFFGNSPAVGHAVNVLLFAAAGIAVLLLLRR